MKKGLCIVLLVAVFLNKGYGQNFIQNGSFEDTLQCPDGPGQYAYAIGWSGFNSCDYLNSCAVFNVNPYFYNLCPTAPQNGAAIMGIGFYVIPAIDTLREILTSTLITPLSKDEFYCFSMFVKPSMRAEYFTDALHVVFSEHNIDFAPMIYSGIYTSQPKIKVNKILKDTVNWIEIKGGFYADSAYKNIYIGNLENGSGTAEYNTNHQSPILDKSTLYVIDNLRLERLEKPVFQYTIACEDLQAAVNGADSVRWYRNGQLFSQQPGILLPDIQTGESLMAEYFLCNYTFTDTLTVPPCTVPEPEFPNIITPNADGVNDVFQIEQLAAGSTLVIYNRWGSEVFRSRNYANTWQGQTETLGIETKVPDGTYFYVFITPEGKQYKGMITVVK